MKKDGKINKDAKSELAPGEEYEFEFPYQIDDFSKPFYLYIITKENSINEREVEINENSNLLILQTCTYGHRGTYYVISAVEVANYKYE